jgi:tight adherence protein C
MFASLIHPESLLASAAIFAAVVCGVYGLAGLIGRDERWSRLAPAEVGALSVRKGGSRLERLASQSLGSRLAPTDERERADLKLWLLRAGYDSPAAVQAYYGVRFMLGAILAVGAALLVPVLSPHSSSARTVLSAAVFGAVVGFMIPVIWMAHRKSRRTREIREGLPHIIDLLLVCSEAGLGLDMAIAKVSEQFATTQVLLCEHLDLISAELRAGRPRAEAFRGFAQRTGVPEVISLVNLLVQSDALGTSMAGTLRVVSKDMRDHQLLKAEAMAQKVSSKLSLVLVGCFMPALISSIIAPIIFHIVTTWHGIHY